MLQPTKISSQVHGQSNQVGLRPSGQFINCNQRRQLRQRQSRSQSEARHCRTSYCKPRHTQRTTPCAAGADVADAQTADAPDSDDGIALSGFLGWAIANGVEGVGREGDKIGLAELVGGERGLVLVEDLAEEEVALRVPLRLALTDHPDDEESNELLYEGAPWMVRLAAKLLREKARGKRSAWHPYIQVLPKTVPGPLRTFSWEDLAAIEYPDMRRLVDYMNWVVDDGYRQASRAALGLASREDFSWAMSMVMSRTFGSAGEKGGVGVRMLVPLADMVNHGGHEAGGLLIDDVTATANAEWRLVSPDASGSGGWELHVVALRNILAGEQLLFSYGERSNDDFFLHYGFVPPRNPHDAVVLFDDVPQAVDWYIATFPEVVEGKSEIEVRRMVAAADAAAEAHEARLRRAGLAAALDRDADSYLYDESRKLRLVARSFADGRMAAAFSSLAGVEADIPLSPPKDKGMPAGTYPDEDDDPAKTDKQKENAASSSTQDPAAPSTNPRDGGGGPESSESGGGAGGEMVGLGAADPVISRAVVRRVVELLKGWAPLPGDLKLLMEDEGQDESSGHYYRAMYSYYCQAIQSYSAHQPPPPGLDAWGDALFTPEKDSGLTLPLSTQQRMALEYRAVKKMVCWDALMEAMVAADLAARGNMLIM